MQTLYFRPVVSSIFLLSCSFFSSPNLSRRILDVYHTSTYANLECRCEMCSQCTRLAENTGHKKSPKICHLVTVTQLYQAVSSRWHSSAMGRALDFVISRSLVQILLEATLRNNLGQVVHTYVPLSPSSIVWYWPKGGDALRLRR